MERAETPFCQRHRTRSRMRKSILAFLKHLLQRSGPPARPFRTPPARTSHWPAAAGIRSARLCVRRRRAHCRQAFFRTGQLRVELVHLFFQTGDLFAQRLGLAAQFASRTLLVLACPRAVAASLVPAALGFLFLRVAEPLLIIFQIAVERLNFTGSWTRYRSSVWLIRVTIVRHDNQRSLKVDQRFG